MTAPADTGRPGAAETGSAGDGGIDPPHPPVRLSHLARVTHDAEATVDFYTRIMGMPLVTAVMHDRIPSTGDPMPYLHVFFRMLDGSTLAFFEAPSLPTAPPVSHPMYDVFDHVALEVATVAEVDEWKQRLEAHGIDVVGPTDHTIIYSIYFHDPNGIRLEITTPLVADWNDRPDEAAAAVRRWSETKASAADAAAVVEALHGLVADWERAPATTPAVDGDELDGRAFDGPGGR